MEYTNTVDLLMYASLCTILVTALIAFASIKQLGSIEKYGYITYLLSLFFAVNRFDILQREFVEMPVFYSLLFLTTILVGGQKILDYYNVDVFHKFVYRKYYRITWGDLVYNRLVDVESYKNVIPLQKDASETTIIFTLIVNHPTFRQMHYNTFDTIILINKGLLELKYKGGITRTLKSGDMIKVDRKQVHQFVTEEDCKIKIICIR